MNKLHGVFMSGSVHKTFHTKSPYFVAFREKEGKSDTGFSFCNSVSVYSFFLTYFFAIKLSAVRSQVKHYFKSTGCGKTTKTNIILRD